MALAALALVVFGAYDSYPVKVMVGKPNIAYQNDNMRGAYVASLVIRADVAKPP